MTSSRLIVDFIKECGTQFSSESAEKCQEKALQSVMRTVRSQGCRQIHSLNHKQKNDWQAEGMAALGMANSEFGYGKKGEKQQNSQWPLMETETAKPSEMRELGNSWDIKAAILSCLCASPPLLKANRSSTCSAPAGRVHSPFYRLTNPQMPDTHKFSSKTKPGSCEPWEPALFTGQDNLRKKINSHPAMLLGKGRFGKSKILTPASFINNFGLYW